MSVFIRFFNSFSKIPNPIISSYKSKWFSNCSINHTRFFTGISLPTKRNFRTCFLGVYWGCGRQLNSPTLCHIIFFPLNPNIFVNLSWGVPHTYAFETLLKKNLFNNARIPLVLVSLYVDSIITEFYFFLEKKICIQLQSEV